MLFFFPFLFSSLHPQTIIKQILDISLSLSFSPSLSLSLTESCYLLCSPDWSRTHDPLPASRVLGLQVCATTQSKFWTFLCHFTSIYISIYLHKIFYKHSIITSYKISNTFSSDTQFIVKNFCNYLKIVLSGLVYLKSDSSKADTLRVVAMSHKSFHYNCSPSIFSAC
jgi:hypothetical protein